jgi:hypothetical protein
VRPEQGLLRIRRELGVYANLRPSSCTRPCAMPRSSSPRILDGVDLVFVRELTGGIYFGEKTRTPTQATDLCSYSVAEIERITRVAGRLAMRAQEDRLDRQVQRARDLAPVARSRRARDQERIPGVSIEHMLVDSAAMHLIRRPRDFDVLLTENMFGDILTDEGAMLASSLGLLPSASIGDGPPGTYEAHLTGSAPDIAGKGVANPLGTILSVAMAPAPFAGTGSRGGGRRVGGHVGHQRRRTHGGFRRERTNPAAHPPDGRGRAAPTLTLRASARACRIAVLPFDQQGAPPFKESPMHRVVPVTSGSPSVRSFWPRKRPLRANAMRWRRSAAPCPGCGRKTYEFDSPQGRVTSRTCSGTGASSSSST